MERLLPGVLEEKKKVAGFLLPYMLLRETGLGLLAVVSG